MQRPPRKDTTKALFSGIEYYRMSQDTPRPVIYHVIEVDLEAEGLSLMVTPFDHSGQENHLNARTTSQFISEFKTQIAVNASFFRPFKEKLPWNYYPKENDRVTALGFVAANKIVHENTGDTFATACITEKTVSISSSGCPDGVNHAVSGDVVFVQNGITIYSNDDYHVKPYPRTSLALDRNQKVLWLIVVDGKQNGYSEGVTLDELGRFVTDLGGYTAINLDGGGSSTMGIDTAKGSKILNSPIHTRIPMRERPVANHLGIIARESIK